jgi:hypothetical protein
LEIQKLYKQRPFGLGDERSLALLVQTLDLVEIKLGELFLLLDVVSMWPLGWVSLPYGLSQPLLESYDSFLDALNDFLS